MEIGLRTNMISSKLSPRNFPRDLRRIQKSTLTWQYLSKDIPKVETIFLTREARYEEIH